VEAGRWKVEGRGWRLEAGGWKLEAGGWLEGGGWQVKEEGGRRLEGGGWQVEEGGGRIVREEGDFPTYSLTMLSPLRKNKSGSSRGTNFVGFSSTMLKMYLKWVTASLNKGCSLDT
jgi:hypothetical protein